MSSLSTQVYTHIYEEDRMAKATRQPKGYLDKGIVGTAKGVRYVRKKIFG